ncbi:MAG: DUF4406 domain-containing protein [Geothrix sp.]|nr:DUF4406 domain-containing protein [Geothrix sp.]
MRASLGVVYIAGPYSSPYSSIVRQNVAEAVAFGQQVRALGLVPVVPHVAILPTGRTEAEYEAAMMECFELLSRCDAVVLMPTWRSSPGAVLERAQAEDWGIEIFEGIEDLREVADGLAS